MWMPLGSGFENQTHLSEKCNSEPPWWPGLEQFLLLLGWMLCYTLMLNMIMSFTNSSPFGNDLALWIDVVKSSLQLWISTHTHYIYTLILYTWYNHCTNIAFSKFRWLPSGIVPHHSTKISRSLFASTLKSSSDVPVFLRWLWRKSSL